MRELTDRQAKAVLEQLLADHTITHRDITRALRSVNEEITTLEQRLNELRAIQNRTTPRTATRPRTKNTARRTTTARRESMQLQGRYLGLLMKLPKQQREKYKKLAKTKGREAAIKALQARK